MAILYQNLAVVLASKMFIMNNELLYLKTILCCSACDGEIAPEEIVQDAITKKEEIDNIPKVGIYASCYVPISYMWPEEIEDMLR